MFNNLREGTSFYILYKGQNPKIEVGVVDSVSKPYPLYSNGVQPAYPLPGQEMVVDVTVNIGDKSHKLEKLPANKDITDNDEAVVSCSQAAINCEIENMKRNSQKILDSMDYHKSVVANCDEILKIVNPSFAKEKEQEEKISKLESKIESIEAGQNEMLSLLKELKSTKVSNNKKD